jgi:hypothetical protein
MLQELRDITVLAEGSASMRSRRPSIIFTPRATRPRSRHADALYRPRGGTKKIKFASLGLVLPARDLRTAEEIAVLDHLTKGRFIAGFARGYQDRWTNVLGQHYHVSAATMDGSAVDNHNRDVFEEMFHIIKMAWTEESIRFKGKYYEVPTPYEGGIQRWPVGKTWTKELGAIGMPRRSRGRSGSRRTEAYPRLTRRSAPFSVSETIRWCATQGIVRGS